MVITQIVYHTGGKMTFMRSVGFFLFGAEVTEKCKTEKCKKRKTQPKEVWKKLKILKKESPLRSNICCFVLFYGKVAMEHGV